MPTTRQRVTVQSVLEAPIINAIIQCSKRIDAKRELYYSLQPAAPEKTQSLVDQIIELESDLRQMAINLCAINNHGQPQGGDHVQPSSKEEPTATADQAIGEEGATAPAHEAEGTAAPAAPVDPDRS